MAATAETESSLTASMTCDKERHGLKLSLFAFDFDGTCTVEDTTRLYYKATNRYRQSSDVDTGKLDSQWGELAKRYWAGHMNAISTSLVSNTSPADSGLNVEGLRSFLQAVHSFDAEMSPIVEQSGLLKGISNEGILSISSKAELNAGCLNVLHHVNCPLYAISINWSEDLIHSKLGHVKYLKILANNFPVEDNLTTGAIGHSISTAFDKEKAFQRLAHQYNGPDAGITVFVGDSIVDLLALLQADVGIVVGKSSTLRKVIQAFGIKLLPIQSLSGVDTDDCRSNGENSNPNQRGVLYEVTSWNDIGFSLFGSQYEPSKYE